jgi:hypothetical protein
VEILKMTRTPMPFCCTVALGAASMIALAGFAPDDQEKFLFTENFNDNSIDPPWDSGSFSGKAVTNANGRLQFSANGATGQLGFAGLVVEPWGANIRRDFQVEANSFINLTNVTGNELVFLGFGFANEGDLAEFPNTGTVLGAGVLRTSAAILLGWVKLVDGAVVDFDGDIITQTSGKITVEVDKSDNELSIRRNGQTVTYNGFFTDFGAAHPTDPLVITLGCVTANGNASFPGSRVRLDNFEFNGFKRLR